MRFFEEDPALRQQLMGVLMVAAAAPGFWDFLKWVFGSIGAAITGKKKITNQDISDSVQKLREESAEMKTAITEIKEEARSIMNRILKSGRRITDLKSCASTMS